MAETYRMVNTRFWSDGWIRKLNALDRYFFLYLLTNEHVNWCGIYELEIGMMAFESGIDKEDLEKSMLPRLYPKIIYEDGWVYIKNFSRYHTGGVNAEKGRKAAIEALPERVKAKINSTITQNDRFGKPLGGGSPSASASASAFAFTSNYAPPDGDIVDELLNEEGKIRYDYQYQGLMIYEKTNAPKSKKAECIRLAKLYPALINPAISFCLDYPQPQLKWKMFLWKLNQLKKDGKTQTTAK